MYSLRGFGKMLAEPVRRKAYFGALEAAIRPGSTVLEIGTGPGVFALHAARCGAGKVYAVESSESIQVARELVAANGLVDRVELIEGLSTELELSRRADVIFSDLRGVLPLFTNHVPSIVDARSRHLAPGGVLIPQRDSLWVALAEAEETHLEITSGWTEQLGFDLSIPLSMVTSAFAKAQIEAHQLLTDPRCWAELDYRELVHQEVAGSAKWKIEQDRCAHGLVVWFSTLLYEAYGFSNAPGEPELIYGQAFFPFPAPELLEQGDLVTVELRATPVAGDYVWSWRTAIQARGGARRELRQSTFYADPLSPSRLRRRAAEFVPSLGSEGQWLRFVLDRIDGRRSLREIAEEAFEAHPRRFSDLAECLAQVSEIAATHS